MATLPGERKAGLQKIQWNLRAGQGGDELVAPGEYTARLKIGGQLLTKPIRVEAE